MVEKSDINNVMDVFKDGCYYYFKHFVTFAKYMTFPVFGQILGLIVIAITTLILTSILPSLANKYTYFQTTSGVLTATIISTFPGLVILLRAFWKYLVAYGSISSMAINLNKSSNIYDIAAHDELINRSAGQYILLWILYGLFGTIAIIPIFWIPCFILFVFFILIFQVFTLNEANNNNGNAIEAFKQSYGMIKGHFISTLLLLSMVFTVSYLIIPHIFESLIGLLHLEDSIMKIFNIPRDFQIAIYSAEYLVKLTIGGCVSSIVIMFTLPIRTITWTLWYKKLLPKYNRELKKATKKSKVVKLDQRILDRAMEDYE